MISINRIVLIGLIGTVIFVFSIAVSAIFSRNLKNDVNTYLRNYLEKNEIKYKSAECYYKNEKISLKIPSNWKYEIVENNSEIGIGDYNYGIKFYPDESNHEKYAGIYNLKSKFGVCGTGLRTEKFITGSGIEACAGYFDLGKNWNYVLYIVPDAELIAFNNNLEDEIAKEALNILKTIEYIVLK